MFNIVKIYQFSINGKLAIIQATSLIAATDIIENSGYNNYRFIKIMQ